MLMIIKAEGDKHMNKLGKTGSTVVFFICVALIGLFAYIGAFGLNVGDYRIFSFGEKINKGLDLQGGASVLEEIQPKSGQKITNDLLEQTKQLISMRVNKLGVSETSVTIEGGKRIRIDMPGKFDTKDIIDSIGKTGTLTFKDPSGNVILTGSDVKKATGYLDQNGQPTIGLTLNASGKKKFADATQKFYGQQIAIYMDNDMLTNPRVDAVITDGSAVITGSKDLQEAQYQASIINAGALPVPVKVVTISIVGPTIGSKGIDLSLLAGKVGIGLVLLFMLLYYRVPGLIADIALVFYVVILLFAFDISGVTLTLPGIAGFLLTVGMAVDANVLIFERMKEELKSGKSIRSSIDSGFHRAMSSVVDSNLTTIIAGIVLYILGTGSIKGFAFTLVVGVILSMLTAVIVSKHLIALAGNMGWFAKPWTIGTFGVHDMRRGVK